MNRLPPIKLCLALLSIAILVVAPGCGTRKDATEPPLVVGSKRFTESYILGELLRQAATKASGVPAVHKRGLGNTGIVTQALEAGDIDVYAEYTGTIRSDILKLNPKGHQDMATLNRALAPLHLEAGVPLGFNDSYALAMRADQAAKLGVASISDLAKHPSLRFGLSSEFLKRADGWPGLKAAYNLPFSEPRGLDHGVAYAALSDGQIDVTDAYSTDAAIQQYHLFVLKDDRAYFPRYDAVLLYRADMPRKHPKAWIGLQHLQGTVSDAVMTQMNAAADVGGQSYEIVAQRFLTGGAAAVGSSASTRRSGLLAAIFTPDFGQLTAQHVELVFISLALACLVGIPLGIVAFLKSGASGGILTLVGLIQTIPSLALFVFLIPVFHIGTGSAIIALFLYSLLPIVRNTYTGLADIAPSVRESALALGLPLSVRLTKIELPLAMRAILAGVKTAAIINVGTATIAAFVGAGGYGEKISEGLANNNTQTMLAGAIPAAVLALLVQGGFDLIDRALVPRGLRLARK